MRVGDLVQKTYGVRVMPPVGHRPIAIVVGWYKYGRPGALAQVRWVGGTGVEEIGTKYLEVVSASR